MWRYLTDPASRTWTKERWNAENTMRATTSRSRDEPEDDPSGEERDHHGHEDHEPERCGPPHALGQHSEHQPKRMCLSYRQMRRRMCPRHAPGGRTAALAHDEYRPRRLAGQLFGDGPAEQTFEEPLSLETTTSPRPKPFTRPR